MTPILNEMGIVTFKAHGATQSTVELLKGRIFPELASVEVQALADM